MAGFSDYLEAEILDHVFGAATYTPPATIYVGAFTAAPTDAGGGTEKTIGSLGYTRVAITNNLTNFPAASGTNPTLKSNGTIITFPTNTTTDWGAISHIALFDASTGGNQLGWSALASTKTVTVGDTLTIPVGDLDITLD